MSIQLNLSPSFLKAIAAAAVATAMLLTSGCATPTGAAFTTAEAAPDGQAQVYLYRRSVFYASGQSASVQVNNKDMGELFNASWMRITLPPGEHVLGVKPSPISKTYEIKLQLEDKQTQYVEFAVSHSSLPYVSGNAPMNAILSALMAGSSIAPRTPGQGVAEMQGLKSVK